MPRPHGRSDDHLMGFFQHGVERTEKITSGQYVTGCPFCGKKDKFYINIQNLCWDCKVCGRNGNFSVFMEEISNRNQEIIKPEHLEALAKDRELPVAAFEGWDIGYDGSMYTLPLYDFNGKLADLKCYTPGYKMLGTKGGKQSLIAAPKLSAYEGDQIFICEGQWDTYAMAWLMKSLNKPGLVLGVPGANVFNEHWIEYFYQREVYLCYDNDEAGVKGETRAYGLLEPVAKRVHCLHWPESKPDGYDIRDFIKFFAVKKRKPKRTFRRIIDMMQGVPRSVKNFAVKDKEGKLVIDERREEKLEAIPFPELVSTYRKWLYIPDITPIKVLFASIFANRIPGEMIWLFLVGAPSSLKTELIRSLSMSKHVEMVSTLTPRTLVSGFITSGGKDHSLLRVLDGRILAIKDYTSVLSMNAIARDEIHGQLRDVYDGQIDKMFGHGQHRRFKVKFGIVAAVTATIEKFGAMQQTLGERFLRYVLPKDQTEKSIMDKLKRGTSNISHEDEMRTEIGTAVKRFIGTFKLEQSPDMPDEIALKIHYLSRFTALMRGFVDRDYKNNVLYRPDSESPVRLSKQLFKLGLGLAMVEARGTVTSDDYRILRDIAIGTCPGRLESMIKALYVTQRPLRLREMSTITDFPIQTVKAVLDDLVLLKLVRLEGGFKGYYFLSDMCKTLIAKAEVYPPTLTVRFSSKKEETVVAA